MRGANILALITRRALRALQNVSRTRGMSGQTVRFDGFLLTARGCLRLEKAIEPV